jgi:Zn finger protein HypA/HybF involved in hydrogenase expression
MTRRDTKESFIIKANFVQENKYLYNEVIYINNKTKIDIRCPSHGIFQQTPSAHLKGQGCPQCFQERQRQSLVLSTSIFIERSNIEHSNKYDYSISVYIDGKTKIKIICQEHGLFEQRPVDHLAGAGCPACGKLCRLLSLEEYKNKANMVHNHRYDYSFSIYTNSKEKIKIRCHKHGIFEQVAADHLYGNGCPKCSTNISKSETEWLDSLKINQRQVPIIIDGLLLKVDAFDPATNTIYEFYGDFWHGNPNKYQPDKINNKNHKTFGELYQATLDRERIIKNAGYNLIIVWESDFIASKSTTSLSQ